MALITRHYSTVPQAAAEARLSDVFRKAWKGNLGLNIRLLRLAGGLTQEAAAETFQCTLRHWQRLEGGSQNPSLVVMVRIARTLRIKPEQLLQWAPGQPGPPELAPNGRRHNGKRRNGNGKKSSYPSPLTAN